MDSVSISKKLKQTTYIVEAYQGGEKYSSGSAFCVHPKGFLVTAAHVITGRLPVREEDWKDPNVVIMARTSEGQFSRYEPAVCGINIEFPGPLKEVLQIDLAILRPSEICSEAEFLPVSRESCSVGQKVLMAGFPDELEPPLLWTRAINYEYQPIKESTAETSKNVERLGQLLMVKSGMIGNVNYLSADSDGTGKKKLDVFTYYIDNVMHSGSSGGPVVNELGLAIGAITTRAVTRVSWPDLEHPNKEIPSGSALAVSVFTVWDYVEQYG